MNRNIASSLAIGSAAVLAAAIIAVTPGNAHAESIAEYTIPFAGSRSRADVQADLAAQRSTLKFSASEWAMQDNPPSAFKSSYAPDQVREEFKAARGEVSAFTSEDSGSAYLTATPGARRVSATSTMGGPAR